MTVSKPCTCFRTFNMDANVMLFFVYLKFCLVPDPLNDLATSHPMNIHAYLAFWLSVSHSPLFSSNWSSLPYHLVLHFSSWYISVASGICDSFSLFILDVEIPYFGSGGGKYVFSYLHASDELFRRPGMSFSSCLQVNSYSTFRNHLRRYLLLEAGLYMPHPTSKLY